MYNKQIEMKECVKCGKVKPLTEFHKAPKTKDGLQSYCKPCIIHNAKVSQFNNKAEWYHKDGYMTEKEHFNAAIKHYAELFNMPQLLKHLEK